MAKSMVERYEQILQQDPTSAIFVELAKVLLEQGEAARTIEVCEKGISHHPHSVIGHVLWGKALLQLGKPAQAMEQFEQAIGVDKENAHAYNLISEVLVQRGLFRSALPILRKAAALQPNDGRVKLWLEQTQQALAGGPPPVMADLPGLTANALAPQPVPEEPAAEQPPAALSPAAEPTPFDDPAPAADRTPFDDPPLDDEEEEVTAVRSLAELQAQAAALQGGAAIGFTPPPAEPVQAPPAAGGDGESEGPKPERVHVVYFHKHPPRPPLGDDEDTLPPGETRADLREAMAAVAAVEPVEETTPVREVAAGGLLPDIDDPDAPGQLPDRAGPPIPEATDGQYAEAAGAPRAERPASSGGGLLGDLPPPEEEDGPAATPAAARPSEGARTAPAARSRAAVGGPRRALLDDIPDAVEPQAPAARPRTSSGEVDAAAIAAAYEKELREKLAKNAATPSFLARYGMKLAVGAVVSVVLIVGIGAFISLRAKQGGQTLTEVLDRTERIISQDTSASLREALTLLDRAREMDDGNSRMWALTAYTHALLYADHGGAAEHRQQALKALEQAGVRTGHMALSLATDALVADEQARPIAHRAVLESQEESSAELHTVAGSLLLEEKQPEKAVKHFDRALQSSQRPVRALVKLGGYYQAFNDHTKALEVYSRARELSSEHPLARIGVAESRLALGQELETSLQDMQVLAAQKELPEALRARQQLVHGRLLSVLGKDPEALALLAAGTQGPLAFDFHVALGEASRAAGKLDEAQQSYLAALKLRPKSEEAREGLGRTLLDRDRVKEALAQIEGDNSRGAALVRAAAYARLEDWKRVRTELEKTRVNNRYPPEAVGYLAMADTMEGNGEQAREVLEKAVNSAKQPRTDLQVALGRVYWRLAAPEKARAQFEKAMKDPRDYEAPCALGRLVLSRGLPDMALPPLTQAVERNGFHGEARDALGRALLALGRTEEGLKHFEAWKAANPDSAEANKGLALALFHAGKRPEAAEAALRAVRQDPSDAEARRVRAAILFASGDAKGGVGELERANKLDLRDPETYCEIAHSFLRADKPDNAIAAFEAAMREAPDSTCGQVGVYYVDPSEGGRTAAKALDAIAAKAPAVWDKAFAQTAKAQVLLNAGALKDARAAAEEAVKLAPFSGRAHLALGLVALKQRQEESALAALTKAAELEPAHGMARLALADVLVKKQEELPRAIQEYEAFLKLASSSEEAKRVKKALPALKKRAVK
jgi:tetratricopeptide (TPR) repeat protein